MTQRYVTPLGLSILMHTMIVMVCLQFTPSYQVERPEYKLQIAGGAMNGSLSKLITKTLTPAPAPAPAVVSKIKTHKALEPIQAQESRMSPQISGATGSGTGTNDRPGNAPYSLGTAQGTVDADLKAIYQAELRAKIDENKFYPSISKRLGHQGVVVVAFTLTADGTIQDVKLEKPSEYSPLNESALDAVKRIGKFKAIPKIFGMDKMSLKIPIRFVTL
jgi:periplasmic protein TonB